MPFLLPVSTFAVDSGTGPIPCKPNTICNPLQVNSIQDLVAVALKFAVNLLAIAGGLYVMWSGFQLVTAQGDEKKLESAKKAFMNAIIGMAIILGAWAIATVVAKTISQVTGSKEVILNPIK